MQSHSAEMRRGVRGRVGAFITRAELCGGKVGTQCSVRGKSKVRVDVVDDHSLKRQTVANPRAWHSTLVTYFPVHGSGEKRQCPARTVTMCRPSESPACVGLSACVVLTC